MTFKWTNLLEAALIQPTRCLLMYMGFQKQVSASGLAKSEVGLWELGPDPPAALYPDLAKPRESNSN